MAPRRGARAVKVTQSVDYDNLTVKEVLCPICRSILIEPVTLPCNHVFCSSCFQSTMENANLVCPLCRMRIGSWLRSCKKENKLINVEYWNAIKRLFPEQIKNKLEGVEDNIHYEDPLIQLAKPGELKKEYETQIQKETESFRKERQAEISASEALIKKIREEEEYEKIIEEEKLRLDEEIARKLAEELNTIEKEKRKETMPQLNDSKNNIISKKSGPLDRFLQNKNMKTSTHLSFSPKPTKEGSLDYTKKDYTCRVLCHDIENDWDSMGQSNTIEAGPPTLKMLNQQISLELQQALDLESYSDCSDSIESECRYFKPIDYRRSLPCQRTTPIRVPAVKGRAEHSNISAPKGKTELRSNHMNSAFADFHKLSVKDDEVEEKNKSTKHSEKHKSTGMEMKKSTTNSKSSMKATITKNTSPEKKKIDKVSPQKIITTPKKDRSQAPHKTKTPLKRRLSTCSPDNTSKKKKNETNFDESYSRLLQTPSSPFRGFCTDESDKQPFMKFTRHNYKRNEDLNLAKQMDVFDSNKIKLQVKSDYELAKKLQESFNSSYSTRSTAPRRGIKVTRQATLDNMLSKKTKV